MNKIFRIRWLLLIIAAYVVWRAWPRGQEMALPVPLPEPAAEASAEPSLQPSPAPKPLARRRKRPQRREAIVVETQTPAPRQADIKATPGPKPSPLPREAQGVLESVAFKDEEEVLANLGEPDEQFEHDDRVSWYYSKPARNRNGKPVCPEVQFIDEEARMVVMWPPEKMKEKIATARRIKAEGAQASKAPQTYTFVDSFRYLGVGTPDYTVLEDLGAPDSKEAVEGREEWNYDTLIVENGASRRLTVVMQKGKVVEVRGR